MKEMPTITRNESAEKRRTWNPKGLFRASSSKGKEKSSSKLCATNNTTAISIPRQHGAKAGRDLNVDHIVEEENEASLCSTECTSIPTEVSLNRTNESLVGDDLTLESGDIFTDVEAADDAINDPMLGHSEQDDMSHLRDAVISPPCVRREGRAAAEEELEVNHLGQVIRVLVEKGTVNKIDDHHDVQYRFPWFAC